MPVFDSPIFDLTVSRDTFDLGALFEDQKQSIQILYYIIQRLYYTNIIFLAVPKFMI